MAKIIPLEKDTNRTTVNNAVNRIKKLSQEMHLGKFDWDQWKLYKDDEKK